MNTTWKAFTMAAAFSGAVLLASGAYAAQLIPNAQTMPAGMASSYSSVSFDVTDIDSNDVIGDPDNEIRWLNLGAGAHITGIGWDVTLFADAPSWLSEIGVQFSASDQIDWVSLNPGVGDAVSGFGSYSSGGIIDLVGLGYDFYLGSDGLLRLEFFESFDDFPDDWDGYWASGALTFAYEVDTPQPGVPEPSSWMMMIGGLGLVGAAMRRNRTSTKVSFA